MAGRLGPCSDSVGAVSEMLARNIPDMRNLDNININMDR